MSKLRKRKVASKSPGGSSMKIDELFKVQTERRLSESPNKSDASTSKYFSPEKKSPSNDCSSDGGPARKLTKLSRRFRTHSNQESLVKIDGKEQDTVDLTLETDSGVEIVEKTLTPKRKVDSDCGSVTENGDSKKLRASDSVICNDDLSCGDDNVKNRNCYDSSDNEDLDKTQNVSSDSNTAKTSNDVQLAKARTIKLDSENSVTLSSNNCRAFSKATEAVPTVSACSELSILHKEEILSSSKEMAKEKLCDVNLTNGETTVESEMPGTALATLNKEETSSKDVPKDKLSDKNLTNDDTATDDADAQDAVDEFRIPYYLENFQVILRTVLADEFYIPLFNEADMLIVEKFNNLSENGQKLYIRLFQRKYRWLRKDKISYPRIAEDLSEVLDELTEKEFILDEKKMNSLEEILAALPAPELKHLAKSLRLNASQQMSDLTQAILKHSRQTNISSFFTAKQKDGGTAGMITNRAKSLLGSCYKLSAAERDVFIRSVMLFSLHQIDGDMDESSGGQTQLFQMLMTNIGRMVYPSYTVNKKTRIFKERSDVIRFQAAVIMEDDIFEAMDKHQFDEAMDLYKKGYAEWKTILKNKNIIRNDKNLEEHLRMYTAGSVYGRVLTYGIEVLQKKRMYKEAVELLQELLGQKVYQPSYRGRWYDRLALNLDQHLKQHNKALDTIKEALADDNVRFGHRYALFQRAQRICNSPSKKNLKNRWKEFMEDMFVTVMEAPTVTIEGKLLTKNTQFAVYVTEESSDQDNEKTLTKRVEDVALAHYKENGYPEGLHGEGSTITFLLVLLMWRAIYDCDIPDTFLNPYHSFPLDLRTDHFYKSRKEVIDQRLELIRNSSPDELSNMLGESWSEHEGVLSVNWERFRSVEHAQGLVKCIGGHHLASMFDRMIKNMRFSCSGFPDLVVWNPETLEFRVSEVKGPGDRLSVKQILWLDYLVNFGIKAETCYVRAVGCKRLQTT